MTLRILVIDDDEAALGLISLIACERGHDVVAIQEPLGCPVYTGTGGPCRTEFACRKLQIVGHPLPRMSGLDFVRGQLARGCGGSARTKAVVSGAWTERELADAAALGCRAFRKPFLGKEIANWLAEMEGRFEGLAGEPPGGRRSREGH